MVESGPNNFANTLRIPVTFTVAGPDWFQYTNDTDPTNGGLSTRLLRALHHRSL
ncbi:MAG: hypothetical protein QM757_35405 [Paludibaculum sp.]